VLPLAIAHGPAPGPVRHRTSVLGGMITGTFLAIFFIPLFYVFVVQVFGHKTDRKKSATAAPGLAVPAEEGH